MHLVSLSRQRGWDGLMYVQAMISLAALLSRAMSRPIQTMMLSACAMRFESSSIAYALCIYKVFRRHTQNLVRINGHDQGVGADRKLTHL